jgi:hypothetical protein
MYHSLKGWYTSFMTESFRREDTSPERVKLEVGQVEVFFDGSDEDTLASVVLDVAEPQKVIEDTPFGIFEYDELVLSDGTLLIPADLAREERIVEFGESLEPVVRLSGGALLRTAEYRHELRFLEIVKNDTTISERKAIQETLRNGEKNRIYAALTEQRKIFDGDETLELWIRLEAANDPDKALVGKIIMARLAFFMSHDTRIGIAPMVYSANNDIVTRIPQQLEVHENWLYNELN